MKNFYEAKTEEKIQLTIDQMQKYQEKTKQAKEKYSSKDIAFIRSFNYLPNDGIIKPLKKENKYIDHENLFCSFLKYECKEKVDKTFLKTQTPYYRSTIHFTENGLVSSHMYGNFSNDNFILIEPASSLINNDKVLNFAGQDTYIEGEHKISSEAILLVERQKFSELFATNPNLGNYNIIQYEGNGEAVVREVLMDLGYTPELIGTNYIIDSETKEYLIKQNEELAQQHNATANEKHWFSAIREKDLAKQKEISEQFNKLLNFIIEINGLDKSKFNGYLERDYVRIIYKKINLQGIYDSIEIYNQIIEKLNSENKLPTAEEISTNGIGNLFYDVMATYENTNQNKKT